MERLCSANCTLQTIDLDQRLVVSRPPLPSTGVELLSALHMDEPTGRILVGGGVMCSPHLNCGGWMVAVAR